MRSALRNLREVLRGFFSSSPYRIPLALFCAAVLLRILFFFSFPLLPDTNGDYPGYRDAAVHLLTAHTFGTIPFLAPGWPLALAALYTTIGQSVFALAFLQSILGGLLTVGSYLLGVELFGRRSALIAALLVMLWPPFLLAEINYGSSLLLYAALLLFGFFFFIKNARAPALVYAILSGLLFAWGALTDPVGLYVPAVLLVWFVARLAYHRRVPSRRALAAILAWIVCVVAPIALWAHRNAIVFADTPGMGTAPFVSKRIERDAFTPHYARALMLPFSSSHLKVGLEGAEKFFLIPYALPLMNAFSPVSSLEAVRSFFTGEALPASARERATIAVKALITILHLAALALGIAGIAFLSADGVGPAVALLLLYTFATSVAVGSLGGNHFASISPLPGFLVPLMPLLIVFAAAYISRGGRAALP